MSLLDGNDTVQVYPEVATTDGYSNPIRKASATPTAVTGRVQPLAGTEDSQAGQAVDTRYRLICRTFPAGAFSHVTWGGRTWDVDGEPLSNGGSPATAHVVVILKARGPAAV